MDYRIRSALGGLPKILIVLGILIVVIGALVGGLSVYRANTKGGEEKMVDGTTRVQIDPQRAAQLHSEADALKFHFLLESEDKTNCNANVCTQSYWILYGMPGNLSTELGKIYDEFTKNGWTPAGLDKIMYADRAGFISYVSNIYNNQGKFEGERVAFTKGTLNATVSFGSRNMARVMAEPGIYDTCIDNTVCKLVKKHMTSYETFSMVELSMPITYLQ